MYRLCWLLVLLLQVSLSRSQSCLRNLRILGSTPTAITLGWNYTCPAGDRPTIFKVYYEHLEWKACPTGHQDEQRGPGRGNGETGLQVQVLDNLHPNSAYKLTVKALPDLPPGQFRRPEELDMVGETLPDIPGVAPVNSSIPPRLDAESLKFYWKDPLPSQCQLFHSDLDGTFFVLKGTDRWNVQEEQRGSTQDGSRQFQHLSPYSSYALFLYARNPEGKHNPEVYLKLAARTLAARPLAPRDLRDHSDPGDQSVRLLKWLPPYPPSGVVNFYSIRWRNSNGSVWLGTEDVPPSDDLCDAGDVSDFAEVDIYERPVCHVVKGLDPKLNYTFQVSAFNEGIPDRSNWSQDLVSTVYVDDAVLGLSQKAWISILVISLVVILFIILFLIYISHRCIKQKTRYKNVPLYVSSYPPSNGTAMTGARSSYQGPPGSTMTGTTSFGSDTSSFQRPSSLTTGPSSFASRHSYQRQSTTSTTVTSPGYASSSSQGLGLGKYQHHLLPFERRNSRQGSIQEQPLPMPPDPKDEHLYEELQLKQEPADYAKPVKPADNPGEDQSDDEDFLKPKVLEGEESTCPSKDTDSENDYLPPRKTKSADTLDIEDYLKPTFNQFEQINPRDLSPPKEAPPPIPVVSYMSVPKS